jgi:hypothetical protein
MLKSIKIKYVKNLTIVYNIYKQPQIPKVNMNVPGTNNPKSKQVEVCNDEHIQRIIRNGGL